MCTEWATKSDKREGGYRQQWQVLVQAQAHFVRGGRRRSVDVQAFPQVAQHVVPSDHRRSAAAEGNSARVRTFVWSFEKCVRTASRRGSHLITEPQAECSAEGVVSHRRAATRRGDEPVARAWGVHPQGRASAAGRSGWSSGRVEDRSEGSRPGVDGAVSSGIRQPVMWSSAHHDTLVRQVGPGMFYKTHRVRHGISAASRARRRGGRGRASPSLGPVCAEARDVSRGLKAATNMSSSVSGRSPGAHRRLSESGRLLRRRKAARWSVSRANPKLCVIGGGGKWSKCITFCVLHRRKS